MVRKLSRSTPEVVEVQEPYISVIVPIYNEAGAIHDLHQQIRAAVELCTDNFEIVYIDDGSTDDSLEKLLELTGATVVLLNRNYGQATALDAGFKQARGEIVVSLDGDGQNDPQDIPRLLEKLLTENLDVVAGWRKQRNDKIRVMVLTRIGRWLRRIFINDGVHDAGCTLRVYRSVAVKSLDIQGEMHRYIIALLRWKGFRIGEVIVTDRARVYGKSKYGMTKAVRGLIDLIYIWFIHKYSQRPLHIFGYASMVIFCLGVLFLGYATYQKIFMAIGINRSGFFLLGSFSVLAAIMLFSFGIVIDLLIRIHLNNSHHEKRYYIRAVTKTS
jgi:glycosyltransferase involved in cell wall biosynthesis